MRAIEILLEDYKRRLDTAEELIKQNKNNGSVHDEKRAERLQTKASVYKSMIVDIERTIRSMKHGNDFNDRAKNKLENIIGAGFIKEFPIEMPNSQWVGAVLDFLNEIGVKF